jgi:hypothetical protein
VRADARLFVDVPVLGLAKFLAIFVCHGASTWFPLISSFALMIYLRFIECRSNPRYGGDVYIRPSTHFFGITAVSYSAINDVRLALMCDCVSTLALATQFSKMPSSLLLKTVVLHTIIVKITERIIDDYIQ